VSAAARPGDGADVTRATALDRALAHPVMAGLARALAARPGARAVVAPDDPPPRRAAVALVLRVPEARPEAASDPELLLVKRAEYPGDPWSGHVALPGGRAELGDASPWHTAARETWEETGLDLLAHARLLGALDEIYPRTPVLPPIVVRPHVAVVADDGPLVLSAELAAAFWVPLAHFGAPGVSAERVVQVRGGPLTVPSFAVAAHTVWGMTDRILRQLLAVAAMAGATAAVETASAPGLRKS
jgi:8-oxo-dGTP pyrophosphatase MutT (NUDIX family)